MSDTTLPPLFAAWFQSQGWVPRPHQLAMIEAAARGQSPLLVAPTGGGKTLAGFLPSLLALAGQAPPPEGLHTLYVSPLKALATDIARNLHQPVAAMGLPVRVETRSGDTKTEARRRQRQAPPHILLTTPESLALLLTQADAAQLFGTLQALIVDEAHALAPSKRGDQFSLCLARLRRLAPEMRRIGLSATTADPAALAGWVTADTVISVAETTLPRIAIQLPAGDLPWAGHMGLASAPEILACIARARMTILFVNTRAQAELIFQALWKQNADTLPIALHHGSLDEAARQKVEAAMAAGQLRAVVATASLDLGIDWGAVDQVIQLGAPKSLTRLVQRVGRANHRMDEPSRAILFPANRFEVLECTAAIDGVAAGERDGEPPRKPALDVLAQHLLGCACAAPFHPDAMYAEVREAAPYAALPRADFDDVLAFVAHGGYALAAYDRYRKLFEDSQGCFHVRGDRIARQHRMNIGTIVTPPMLRLRHLGGARQRRGGASGEIQALGEVEEAFVSTLKPGDNFIFGGKLLRFLRIDGMAAEVTDGSASSPRVPVWGGSRMALTAGLADRVRAMLEDPASWRRLPVQVRQWLRLQQSVSRLPGRRDLLVETFPRGDHWHLIAYGFEGRNVHQTLGFLLTRRMARAGLMPLGFVASEYGIAAWCLRQPTQVARLFAPARMEDELHAWMEETSQPRRVFRAVAVIAGLIDRQLPGERKTRRQVTINSDLIYDTLRRHQPDHILLRATRQETETTALDFDRLHALLTRVAGRISHMALSRVSPLAVPLLLEIGRESVRATDDEDALLAEAEALIAEAAGESAPLPYQHQPSLFGSAS